MIMYLHDLKSKSNLKGYYLSLLFLFFFSKLKFSSKLKNFFFFPGTILEDTVNTRPEAGKTTPYDREILSRLMQAVPDLDRDKLFAQIQEAKNDVSGKSVLIMFYKCMVFRSVVDECVRF